MLQQGIKVTVNRRARWLGLITATGAALILTAALMAAASSPGEPEGRPAPRAYLAPDLAKALASAAPDARLNVIVEMRQQLSPATFAVPRTARGRMVDALQATAERTQADVRAYLAARALSGDVTHVTPFWIFNGLAVNGARPEVVRDLAARPDVALIRLDHWRRWIEAPEIGDGGDGGRSSAVGRQSSAVEWGVERIRADQVWHTLGVSGTGVVVANIDSGVDWQHPALQAGYRGYSPKGFIRHAGNWYDATDAGALYPVDGNGHGSHTMGTIAGQGGVGVAPGARWIAVRAFDSSGFGLDSWIHAAFEWLLAPDGDPALAPHVVNNSWGTNIGTLATFLGDVTTLRNAGIFVLFSAGNSGPNPRTVGSPASLPGAFAVGASDFDGEVANFSSRGPSPWGEVRPHVVAPGVNVNSALPGGNYGLKQGTSMAAPHVAGTAALMLSVRPDLTITRTAFILTSTAVPLTGSIPNNDSGYGQVDAYAAVALAGDAGLISGTVRGGGLPLPGATLRATAAISGLEGTAASDQGGAYQLFLGAGHYDLQASAFGYAAQSAHALPVLTGAVTEQDFDLTPLPTGRLRGMVTAAGGGAPAATVSVLGTPVTATTTGGSYALDLPAGDYTVQARALGHRVVTASVTVEVGQDTTLDFVLPEALRLLLVDSGPWYYQSQAAYYRQALDDVAYAYDERRLKHLPDDVPTPSELGAYDLVIWSAPEDSPRLVGAGEVISDYLSSGGNLLLSGQDVGFWDGGGRGILHAYYERFLHSIFRADNAPSRQVVCGVDSALGGISLTIEGGSGADNQRWPDALGLLDPDFASLACSYADGEGAVIQVDTCNPQRALNLGFGLEGISSAADRADFMARALDWFASPRRTAGLELLPQSDPTQIAPPGTLITHALRLRNLGEAGSGDRIQLAVQGVAWPTTILTPTADLDPCAATPVILQVSVPPGASWDASDVLTLTARSSVSPTLSRSLVFTSKVPAPLLLVDDDRWFDEEGAYEEALRANGLPYDRWEVEPRGVFGQGSPSRERLSWYPAVLWFTAYDWFDPLHPNELARLTGYLDGGGRLFLSSQEYLYVIGPAPLTRDYFGVIEHSEWLSQTALQAVPEHPLTCSGGPCREPVDLDYPFRNWSDSVLPAPGAQVAWRGQGHGQPAALTNQGTCSGSTPGCRWRTALFPFPVEALPPDVRTALTSRLVGWLSWLGDSALQADRAVAQVGASVDYTLTLRNDGPAAVAGATLRNTLPEQTLLLAGPDGGAAYDPAGRRVTWQGDLAPGAAVTFTYRLSLTGGAAHDVITNTARITLADQGLWFERQARVRVAAPDLSASHLTMDPADVRASAEVTVTLVLRNDGLADAPDARAENPLPWTMQLVTGTLSSSLGLATELPERNRVRWQGPLAAGAPVTLTYRAVAPPALQEPTWAYNAARLEDGAGGAWERGGWLYVAPHRFYFPLFFKDGG